MHLVLNFTDAFCHSYCLVCQGKLIAAEDAFRRGTTKTGAPEEAWFNLSSVLAALDRFADAKTAIDNALRLDPDYSAARNRAADLHECLNLMGDNEKTEHE